jgi:hypothetical protein
LPVLRQSDPAKCSVLPKLRRETSLILLNCVIMGNVLPGREDYPLPGLATETRGFPFASFGNI